jgi:hypothetical protein
MSKFSRILTGTAEPNGDTPRFRFRATLRIFGIIDDLDEITRNLALAPTRIHRKGEPKFPSRPENVWKEDAWFYEPPVDRKRPLEEHIMELWDRLRPHMKYLKELKKTHRLDIFCGYRSDCDHAGFEVSHKCLGLFIELEIPFGVSVIIA